MPIEAICAEFYELDLLPDHQIAGVEGLPIVFPANRLIPFSPLELDRDVSEEGREKAKSECRATRIFENDVFILSGEYDATREWSLVMPADDTSYIYYRVWMATELDSSTPNFVTSSGLITWEDDHPM